MRISELARNSGVPVASIKFYLREGLLPEGERTSPTQAQYDETHLTRLRLIRALLGPGGLSVATAREVIATIEAPPDSVLDLLGKATSAVARVVEPAPDLTRVHALMKEWGWTVDEKDCETHAGLAEALDAIDAAGFVLPEPALASYVRHIEGIAQTEIDHVPTDSVDAAVRYVVLGTILVEPLLLALRRMAQHELSYRRFGGDRPNVV